MKALTPALALYVLLAACQTAQADSAPAAGPDRKAMAERHRKMAECLDSDKPLSECHKLMGPGMGMGKGMGMGMMGGGPENCPGAAAAEPAPKK